VQRIEQFGTTTEMVPKVSRFAGKLARAVKSVPVRGEQREEKKASQEGEQ